MKNREEGGGLFRRPKLTPSCSAEGKEGFALIIKNGSHL
jgi:hypothetical protein